MQSNLQRFCLRAFASSRNSSWNEKEKNVYTQGKRKKRYWYNVIHRNSWYLFPLGFGSQVLLGPVNLEEISWLDLAYWRKQKNWRFVIRNKMLQILKKYICRYKMACWKVLFRGCILISFHYCYAYQILTIVTGIWTDGHTKWNVYR